MNASDSIPRSCVIALPRSGGPAILLAGGSLDQLERVLTRIGLPPEACVIGSAVLEEVLPDFVPRDEPLTEDAELVDRLSPACLMARRFDGEPPILINSGTRADLDRVLRSLGYPIGTFAVAGARLSKCVLVDRWDHVLERRFSAA